MTNCPYYVKDTHIGMYRDMSINFLDLPDPIGKDEEKYYQRRFFIEFGLMQLPIFEGNPPSKTHPVWECKSVKELEELFKKKG